MPTRLIRGLNNIPHEALGGVLTIGNFDGVHLGHQALLAEVRHQAKVRGVPSLVMTFEPHPFEFFSKETLTIPRITKFREKYQKLRDLQMDFVVILKFKQDLASVSASDFVSLIERLFHPVHLVIGDDFRFGHKREGDIQLLKTLGNQFQFTVQATPTIQIEDLRVSSTRVREMLMKGDLLAASKLLGANYRMVGRVAHGDKLGRKLGFPTANIHLQRKLTPIRGIYSVLLHGIGDSPLQGAANIGSRPTLDSTRTLLEVHLLDFDQDIYGKHIEVEFLKKLREEERYPNLEMLKDQINKDVAMTRAYFENILR